MILSLVNKILFSAQIILLGLVLPTHNTFAVAITIL